MRIFTPNQMATIEDNSEVLGVSKENLMLNAGLKITKFIENIAQKNNKNKILFICGRGNNGGDCFVTATELIYKGYDVSILQVLGVPKTELARKNFEKIPMKRIHLYCGFQTSNDKSLYETNELSYMGVFNSSSNNNSAGFTPSERMKIREQERINKGVQAILDSEIIVDGVFGTGFHGDIDKETQAYFNAVNSSDNLIKISVDVPSGGNSLNGSVAENTFKADYTICLGFIKTGMTQFPLKEFCGEISVADIGLPKEATRSFEKQKLMEIIDDSMISNIKKVRPLDSHKGDFGHLFSICGSSKMRGAAVMSSISALRSGVGLFTLGSNSKAIDTLSSICPEAMLLDLQSDEDGFITFDNNIDEIHKRIKKADAILLGCGLGVTLDTVRITEYIIKNAECPIIIDADGINCISSDIDILLKKKTDIILTPHPAEMSRLSHTLINNIKADRIKSAMDFAEKYGVTVVLKGAGTITANSKGCIVNTTGNPGMSKGGSGDVLAGIIASFSAQGYPPFEAACFGAYIHGLAGDFAAKKLGHEFMLPSDIINELSSSFKSIV